MELLERLVDSEARRDDAIKDSLRALCSSFDEGRPVWEAAVSAVATLDCLFSLAVWSARGDGGAMCRPVLLPPPALEAEGATGSGPLLDLCDARHPSLASSHLSAGSSTLIPNDLKLGGGAPACVLITGPNMGGKSTLMRTAAACAIVAQLGAYVPARSCRMTPVDRVFTRVGASDRMLAGQSTFYVVRAGWGGERCFATRSPAAFPALPLCRSSPRRRSFCRRRRVTRSSSSTSLAEARPRLTAAPLRVSGTAGDTESSKRLASHTLRGH